MLWCWWTELLYIYYDSTAYMCAYFSTAVAQQRGLYWGLKITMAVPLHYTGNGSNTMDHIEIYSKHKHLFRAQYINYRNIIIIWHDINNNYIMYIAISSITQISNSNICALIDIGCFIYYVPLNLHIPHTHRSRISRTYKYYIWTYLSNLMFSSRVVLDMLKECFTILINKIKSLFNKFQIYFTQRFSKIYNNSIFLYHF